MTEGYAIRLQGVGKMFKLFSSRLDRLIDVLDIYRLMPWRPPRYREFWALRGIDLELKKGQRIGIIGQNGAGKSTLLRLICGNFHPTEGSIEVKGEVQALMSAGEGFHPEFTGYENIRAALGYQNLSREEIEEAVRDIEEFTELGQFLSQPVRAYSTGMLTRLTFATATTIKPDNLIVDEILGAGDGYFFDKSIERMSRLVLESGATVLLVSHALDQIVRFCEEAIWIDRGRVVQRGEAMEVVKAYSQHLNVLNERRLKSKNRLMRAGRQGDAHSGFYNDLLSLRFSSPASSGAPVDFSRVRLIENGEALEELRIGDAQDINPNLPASLQADSEIWSEPREEDSVCFRTLTASAEAPAVGLTNFYLFALAEDADYVFEIVFRAGGPEELKLEIWRNGEQKAETLVQAEPGQWTTAGIELKGEQSTSEGTDEQTAPAEVRAKRRWPGEGSLLIEKLEITGEDGREKVLFNTGDQMTIALTVQARKSETFVFEPVIVVYRLDGIRATSHYVETPLDLTLERGEKRLIYLDFDHLNLGRGRYVLSAALFRDSKSKELRYDLLDRSYEFEVLSQDEHYQHETVFHHPATWRLPTDKG